MANNYLSLPFQPGLLMDQKEHPTVDLNASIAQKLHLLTTTNFGECKFDDNFGCPIWETDFETIPAVNTWRDKTARMLEENIKLNEPRLSNVKVSMGMMQEEFMNEELKVAKQVKRRIELKIVAKVEETSNPFEFNTYFYFAPISFD